MAIKAEVFGKLADDREVNVFTLTNKSGVEARILNYGGIVLSLKVPDRMGVMGDVVLGFDNLDDYLTKSPYFGCLIGRYGNRIADGKFSLNGKIYTLAANNAPNSLHGGLKGFDKVVWGATTKMTANGPALTLNYVSKDGEEGFPGTLSVTAVYTLTEENALVLEYTAETDQDTVVNLTHHSYFNLACKGDVLDHVVTLHSDVFTPVNQALIPTGELRLVAGTPFDFRKPETIGARINSNDQQIKYGGGYDHNWILNKPAGKLGLAATVVEPVSGRVMEVLTTEPATQFYTGNFLDGSLVGKGGWVYRPRNGLCFEPQHYPDSPNQPAFPSTVLKPGQTFSNIIIYRFSVKK
ncbi:MAG: aldose epimerase family protein [bacterium]